MKISRRQFLKRTALASGLSVSPNILASERPPLPIPTLIDVGRGRPVRLDFRPTQTQLDGNKRVEMWGANGHYLAPTVRMKTGDFVKLTYINSLPQPLSINIQGLLAPTEMASTLHRPLEPQHNWSPILAIHQKASTGWYHANTMLHSASQLMQGLAGLWIIEDQESRKSTLPNQYGKNDIPLILQDQLIDKEGKPVFNDQSHHFLGKRLFVNGASSPYLNVAKGWMRLRIVNASVSRRYELRLDNDKPLYVIGTGMGFFAEPLEQESVPLAPSERIEILVDMNGNENVSLISGAKRGFFYNINKLFANDDSLIDNVVLELRPQGLSSAFTNKPSLPAFNVDDFKLTISKERKFQLRPSDRLINQQRFDPNRIDFEVKKGSVERWYITSHEGIGFNIQGAKFIFETQNRQAKPYKQLAWRDTVWLEADQEVTLLVYFEHAAPDSQPFTFGVTDRLLSDKGCMGQFSVK